MRLDNRGQASAELIFVTLIFLIIAGSFIGLISSEMNKTQTGELGKARILGEEIATTINTVYVNGNGYSANITIPSDFNYTADVDNSSKYVTVFYNGRNVSVKLIPDSVQINSSMSSGHKYQAKNNNDTIEITEVS